MSSGLSDGLFQAFLDWLYQSGDIKVPADFHGRCAALRAFIDNDTSSIVNTVVDYSINCASETDYRIESENSLLEKLLNKWLEQININIDGVPAGLQELSKEYFKERWAGSSFCLMRVSNWKDITVDKTTISVPTVLWFVNGSSIYVKRPNEANYKLGTDEYYLDSSMKLPLPASKEDIVIQKPFGRWFDKYPTPYLVRKGVLKNYLTLKVVQEKADEIISKVLPYLFVITKGNDELTRKDITYTDPELMKFVTEFKDVLEKYRNERARTPINAVPYDQKYDHLIPDLLPILKEELYSQCYRAMLSGLGFIDIIQGVSNTRRESVLNPKPFITEVNNGVSGFKTMLMDVINLIIEENKKEHKKVFSDGQFFKIVNSPLKINVEAILDMIRSGYDRGSISIRSYIESLGFDYDTEKERRQKELDEGIEDLMYPHLIQNQENVPDRMGVPAKPRKETPSEVKKPGTPETKNFKANMEDNLETAPYSMDKYPDYLKKYPKHAIQIWVSTWNSVYKRYKDEKKAFAIAWNALKRYMEKIKKALAEEKAEESAIEYATIDWQKYVKKFTQEK